MYKETCSSRSFLAALAASVLLHGMLLATPVVPPAGIGAFSPTATPRLSARIVASREAVGAQTPTEAGNPPLASPDPDMPKEASHDSHAGPSGVMESPLSSPYLTSSEVDVRAAPIDPPPLILPETVLRHHIHGKVELKIFISATGKVDYVEVVSSNYPGELEEAAIEVAKATRFSPALKAGIAVKSVKRIEVLFDPDEPTAPSDSSIHGDG